MQVSGGRASEKPEAGTCLAFLRDREEASVARAKRAKRSVLADEFREVLGSHWYSAFRARKNFSRRPSLAPGQVRRLPTGAL